MEISSSEGEGDDNTKRHQVDIESDSDSDFNVPPAKVPRTSTPVEGYSPRKHALPSSHAFARNSLVDANNGLKAQLAKAQSELALVDRKVTINKANEEEVRLLRSELRLKNEEKKSLLAEKDTLVAEKIAVEKKAMEDRRLLELLNRQVEKLLGEKKEQQKKIGLLEKTRDGRRGTIHAACVNGRIVESHIEVENANDTILCFNSASTGAHCHHIVCENVDSVVRFRNTKWMTPRKFVIQFLSFKTCLLN
jgi:hypothetical protein